MAGPESGNTLSGPIQHGGNLARASLLFPHAPGPWIDLSTGINPYSYPYTPVPAATFSRLPEPALADQVRRIATHAYGAPSAQHLVASPGTQILLPIIASLVKAGARAGVLSPTYAEHARAARLAGLDVIETDSLDILCEGQFAVIVNPNNPTGRVVAKDDILAIAAALRAKGGLLVVDEAFVDVSEAESLAGAVDDGGLIVLRSFGKFYGMAGLRLGFAISSPAVIARIEEKLGPWAVSGPALHVAQEALADSAWQSSMKAKLSKHGSRLDGLLNEAKLTVVGGTSLFRLVGDPRAAALFDHLGRAGIMTRCFAERPDDLRIGLPDDGGWTRLEAALRSF